MSMSNDLLNNLTTSKIRHTVPESLKTRIGVSESGLLYPVTNNPILKPDLRIRLLRVIFFYLLKVL